MKKTRIALLIIILALAALACTRTPDRGSPVLSATPTVAPAVAPACQRVWLSCGGGFLTCKMCE